MKQLFYTFTYMAVALLGAWISGYNFEGRNVGSGFVFTVMVIMGFLGHSFNSSYEDKQWPKFKLQLSIPARFALVVFIILLLMQWNFPTKYYDTPQFYMTWIWVLGAPVFIYWFVSRLINKSKEKEDYDSGTPI